jgi:hypothetical protein
MKLTGKPTNTERRIQSCMIQEASRSNSFHLPSILTSFPGRLHAVLFKSHPIEMDEVILVLCIHTDEWIDFNDTMDVSMPPKDSDIS